MRIDTAADGMAPKTKKSSAININSKKRQLCVGVEISYFAANIEHRLLLLIVWDLV